MASRATNTERVMVTIKRATAVAPSTADKAMGVPSHTESAVGE